MYLLIIQINHSQLIYLLDRHSSKALCPAVTTFRRATVSEKEISNFQFLPNLGLSMNSLSQRQDTEARSCQSVTDSWVLCNPAKIRTGSQKVTDTVTAAPCLLRTCSRAVPMLGWENASSWGIHADFHSVFLHFAHQQTTDYSHSWRSSLCPETEWFNTYSDSLTTESYRNEFKYSTAGKFIL